MEALADAYRYELLPFGIDSVVGEPGIYRTPIFDRLAVPEAEDRVISYGDAAQYAERVRQVFLSVPYERGGHFFASRNGSAAAGPP